MIWSQIKKLKRSDGENFLLVILALVLFFPCSSSHLHTSSENLNGLHVWTYKMLYYHRMHETFFFIVRYFRSHLEHC